MRGCFSCQQSQPAFVCAVGNGPCALPRAVAVSLCVARGSQLRRKCPWMTLPSCVCAAQSGPRPRPHSLARCRSWRRWAPAAKPCSSPPPCPRRWPSLRGRASKSPSWCAWPAPLGSPVPALPIVRCWRPAGHPVLRHIPATTPLLLPLSASDSAVPARLPSPAGAAGRRHQDLPRALARLLHRAVRSDVCRAGSSGASTFVCLAPTRARAPVCPRAHALTETLRPAGVSPAHSLVLARRARSCRHEDKPAALLFLLREVIASNQLTIVFTCEPRPAVRRPACCAHAPPAVRRPACCAVSCPAACRAAASGESTPASLRAPPITAQPLHFAWQPRDTTSSSCKRCWRRRVLRRRVCTAAWTRRARVARGRPLVMPLLGTPSTRRAVRRACATRLQVPSMLTPCGAGPSCCAIVPAGGAQDPHRQVPGGPRARADRHGCGRPRHRHPPAGQCDQLRCAA